LIKELEGYGQYTRKEKSMKKTMAAMIFLAALFMISSYSYSSDLGMVSLSLIQGDVQIQTEDTGDWVAAVINMPLQEGDRIWVPQEGRAELLLSDGTALRLSENSALDILRIEEHSFQVYLDTGNAYVNFGELKGALVQLDTSVASIRAYDRGIFWIDIPDDRSSDISVDRGLVYAETKKGSTTVNEGYTLSIRGDDYADLHPLQLADGWVKWNEERDRELDGKRYSSRYLPQELSAYSYDFDRYGTWRSMPEYGYVWTPSVVVSAGWAPYREGRWVWMRGDYVWVSYEPWGWAPYHYGRWIFNSSFGWCWVPPARGAVYWGPGYVSWVSTPDYVAWVPLAPGEVYYGRGYYGPHSVNITRVNVTDIRGKNVYRNVYVNNGVTIIHKDTFVRGKKDGPVRVKENPFLREKISFGGPDIKPERETRRPDIREIPRMKQPPSRIREIKVVERKKERPLVQKRTSSVMTPGLRMREMPLKIEKSRAPGKRVVEPLEPSRERKEKVMEPSRERKEYKAPAERTTEGPEKQKAPGERKKEFPEQKEMRPGPATKEVPSKIEKSKAPSEKEVPSKPERGRAPAEKKMEKQGPAIETKEPGAPPKRGSEKLQKQISPKERGKEVPGDKGEEDKEIQKPGPGTPFERR
jgi:hypothetical protein